MLGGRRRRRLGGRRRRRRGGRRLRRLRRRCRRCRRGCGRMLGSGGRYRGTARCPPGQQGRCQGSYGEGAPPVAAECGIHDVLPS
ncbi:hypothetical protein FNV68_01705 [Streptomyces sp. S1D4-23]|nr:hypothetical protein FNV61_54700 [Streptomyces sp. RLB3-6]QDO05261.1 hypothetical protein FNV68_01705 [Streptomyces sp. S1D4-23]